MDPTAEREYVEHLRALVPGDLSSLRLVIDCANGAASHVAHELFAATGASVTMIHDHPDGHNINEGCGSTHIESPGPGGAREGADLGLAFDGDADRLVAVDASPALPDWVVSASPVTKLRNRAAVPATEIPTSVSAGK